MASIEIKKAHWEQMHAHVQETAPVEACGFVAGRENKSQQVYPITNALHSTSRYRMAEAEMVSTIHAILEKNWDLMAIYHSHPQGPAEPSPADIAEATFVESVQLIWGHIDGRWQMRAYMYNTTNKNAQEILISIA